MTSTTLVKNLLWQASDQLMDSNPQFGRWDQEFLVNAANDGRRVLATHLPHVFARVDVIKMVPGTKQSIDLVPAARIKPGDGSTAEDMRGIRMQGVPFRNMGPLGTAPGRAVRAFDRSMMDLSSPSWHTVTGKVVTGASWDPNVPKIFWITPGAPADTDVWLELPWVPEPNDIPLTGDYSHGGNDSTKVGIDDRNIGDLLNYILARCHLREAEFAANLALSQAHAELFVSSVNAQAVSAGLPNPKLKGLPMPAGA